MPNFCGGTFTSDARNVEQELTVNLVVSDMDSDGATSKRVMYRIPGLSEIVEYSGAGAGRAHYALNGREFAVIGTAFVEITATGSMQTHGTVALDARPATIVGNGDNGGQLLITSGGVAYTHILASDTFAAVAAPPWAEATMGEMLDGYGVILDATTSTFYLSDLLDMTTFGALSFAARSLAPDPWVSMKVMGRYLWLFGESTSEVWYNVGSASSFPFAPYPASGLVPHGCAAPFSPRVAGGFITWVSQVADGGLSIVASSGGQPEPISGTSMMETIGNYPVFSDAVGDTYTRKGHAFYIITFPEQQITWAYDFASREWCQWGTWIDEDDVFTYSRPRWHVWVFGQHRVLDAETAHVYSLTDSASATDVDGRAIRWLRRAPILHLENQRITVALFELDMAVGVEDMAEVVGDNVIDNYGFEVDLTDWDDASLGGTATRTAVAGEVFEGAGALKLTGSLGMYGSARSSQQLTVIPGETYTASIALRGGGGSAVGTVGLRIRCIETGNYLYEGEWQASGTNAISHPTSNTAYTEQSITFTTESTAATLEFEIRCLAASVSYSGFADNVTLQPVTRVGGPPSVMIRWSKDGGRNWSNELTRTAGAVGEYDHRVRVARCGSGRRMVFEVSGTDPGVWQLSNAYVDLCGDAVTGAVRR